MAKGFNVQSLTDYVQENKDVMLKDIVLGLEGGDTIPMLTKQVGVKTKERLHPLTVSPVLQEATSCGFVASGSTVISEREIDTTQIKINDEWCAEDLLGKFAEYKVRIAGKEDALPFEAEIMGQYIREINRNMEKEIWQGKNSGSSYTLVDGFIHRALSADSASTIAVTAATGTSALDFVKKIIRVIPERIQDNAVIFVSPADFRDYLQDLVDKNYFHYNPAQGAFEEMYIPGSNVKVKKAKGLEGTHYFYASVPENMVYGCDLENAKEELKVWFSDDNDQFRLKVRWNAGVQTLFPDMVVLGERK